MSRWTWCNCPSTQRYGKGRPEVWLVQIRWFSTSFRQMVGLRLFASPNRASGYYRTQMSIDRHTRVIMGRCILQIVRVRGGGCIWMCLVILNNLRRKIILSNLNKSFGGNIENGGMPIRGMHVNACAPTAVVATFPYFLLGSLNQGNVQCRLTKFLAKCWKSRSASKGTQFRALLTYPIPTSFPPPHNNMNITNSEWKPTHRDNRKFVLAS